MPLNAPVITFDRKRFADFVACCYYRALNTMIQAKFHASREPGPSGAVQWTATHEELENALNDATSSLNDGGKPPADPGRIVRDAFVRAMIALYVEGPKPVNHDALADLACRLLDEPQLLPEQMEGFDIVLRPLQ